MTEGECGTKEKHSFHSNSAIHSRAGSSPIRKRLVPPPGGGLSNTAIILFFKPSMALCGYCSKTRHGGRHLAVRLTIGVYAAKNLFFNPRWHYMAIALTAAHCDSRVGDAIYGACEAS